MRADCDRAYGGRHNFMTTYPHHNQGPRPLRRYELKPLSPEELRTNQQILADQMEKQCWYVVVILRHMVAEIAIPVN